MLPEWARDIRNQCIADGISFFMKQMGGVRDKRHTLESIPEDLRIRQFPPELADKPH
jgi:protein gp37